MTEPLNSTLPDQLSVDDPRIWLDENLRSLIKQLGAMSEAEASRLSGECARMFATVQSWPDDLYPAKDAARFVERVIAIQLELARGGLASPDSPDDAELPEDDDDDDVVPPSRPSQRGRYAHVDGASERARQRAAERLSSRPPPAPTSALTLHRSASPEQPAGLVLRDDALPEHYTPRSAMPPLRHKSAAPLPVLGEFNLQPIEVDLDKLDPRISMLHDPRSDVAEAYRALFYRVGATSDAQSLMVTGCGDQDALVCTTDFALAVAEGCDDRVLLIETWFAKPQLAALFNYTPESCFAQRLAEHRRAPDAAWSIARVAETNLHLLATKPGHATAPALDGQALGDAVGRFIASGFRYVVLAGPPPTLDTDARYVARCVDGSVLVLHAGVARQRDVQLAKKVLSGSPLLGYVLLEK